MLNEIRLLSEAVEYNDFEAIVKRWKERFLKFYAVICNECEYEWERVYRTCLFLEAMYGSELAKSYLFYDDTRVELKIREESAVGVLLSEAVEFYVISKRMTKEELLNELDRCVEKIKEEESNE